MSFIQITDKERIRLSIRKDFIIATKQVWDNDLSMHTNVWQKAIIGLEFPLSDFIKALQELGDK